jgi:hypothetical protein
MKKADHSQIKRRNKVSTPKRQQVMFPEREQMGYFRTLIKIGLVEKWHYFSFQDKKRIQGGLSRMDQFLKATGKEQTPDFSSIFHEVSNRA